jgi:cytochrome o ubiquinol oxidase subunit IV
MTHEEPSLAEVQKKWHGSMESYLVGFGVALLLTAGSFLLALYRAKIPSTALILSLIGLGLMQAVAQLIFFLHVGEEEKPKWETLILAFMTLLLLVVVIGSLWIMFDLNNRLMVM